MSSASANIKHVVVKAIITNNESKFLLQLRDNKPDILSPGLWGNFGGGVEGTEDLKTALKRELQEELGIEIDNAAYITEITMDLTKYGVGMAKHYYFHVVLDNNDMNKIQLNEGQALEWLNYEEIYNNCKKMVPIDFFAIMYFKL